MLFYATVKKWIPLRMEILSDATKTLSAHRAGIRLHRTGVAQNRNLTGEDRSRHQQEPPEESCRHFF